MYKRIAPVALLASLLPASTFAAPTQMRLAESFPRTDVINVGASTIAALSIGSPAGGQGTLQVGGLNGAVSKAWLYWSGTEFVFSQTGFVGGNGTYAEPPDRSQR